MESANQSPRAAEPGRIKVRLFFKTWEPKHLHSHVLKTEYAAKPPFIEDICVLLPPETVLPSLEAFQPAFQFLIAQGIVPRKSVLTEFSLLLNDSTTLAYCMETL